MTGFPRHFKFTKAADGAETCRNYNTGKACPNPCVFANVCVSCGGNHRDRDWTGKKVMDKEDWSNLNQSNFLFKTMSLFVSIDQNPTTERVPTIKLPTRPGNMQKLETAKLIRARRNLTIGHSEHEPTSRRPNGQAHGFIFCSDNKSPTHWIKRHSKEPGSAADVKYKGLILGLQLEKDRELRTDGKNGCKHA